MPAYGCESFESSQTGIRLRKAIPDNVKVEIINANPRIGKTASSKFSADIPYVNKAICKVKPDLILACGRIAHTAIEHYSGRIILMPHPAYRQLTNQTLYDIKEKIKEIIKEI